MVAVPFSSPEALLPVELKVLFKRSLIETQVETVFVIVSMIRNSHSLVCRECEVGHWVGGGGGGGGGGEDVGLGHSDSVESVVQNFPFDLQQ